MLSKEEGRIHMEILIVVDMQNDFIDGALGTKEAEAIVPRVVEKIRNFQEDGEHRILYTRDTHGENYLETQEGVNLPVIHCVKGTKGWELHPEIESLILAFHGEIVDKPAFGSTALVHLLSSLASKEPVSSITLVGLCPDICVISNAMLLRAAFPEADIAVDSSCCAGVTPESHRRALEAMKACQIDIL